MAKSLDAWLVAAGARSNSNGWYQDLFLLGDAAVPSVLKDMRRVVTTGFSAEQIQPFKYERPEPFWLRFAFKWTGHRNQT